MIFRSCERSDFQNGGIADMYDSIMQKLFRLPDDTLVRPGHDYHGMLVSTIGEEKQFNPRPRLDKDAFIQFMDNISLPNPNRIHDALPANRACGEKQEA